MDRLIYTALSGASQTLYEQQISANNLANVNTNGFRADMAMATNDKVKGGGFDTRYMAQEGQRRERQHWCCGENRTPTGRGDSGFGLHCCAG